MQAAKALSPVWRLPPMWPEKPDWSIGNMNEVFLALCHGKKFPDSIICGSGCHREILIRISEQRRRIRVDLPNDQYQGARLVCEKRFPPNRTVFRNSRFPTDRKFSATVDFVMPAAAE